MCNLIDPLAHTICYTGPVWYFLPCSVCCSPPSWSILPRVRGWASLYSHMAHTLHGQRWTPPMVSNTTCAPTPDSTGHSPLASSQLSLSGDHHYFVAAFGWVPLFLPSFGSAHHPVVPSCHPSIPSPDVSPTLHLTHVLWFESSSMSSAPYAQILAVQPRGTPLPPLALFVVTVYSYAQSHLVQASSLRHSYCCPTIILPFPFWKNSAPWAWILEQVILMFTHWITLV